MTKPIRWKSAALGAIAFTGLLTTAAAPGAGAAQPAKDKHVLVISVDGLHASDIAQCEAATGGPPTRNRRRTIRTTGAEQHRR